MTICIYGAASDHIKKIYIDETYELAKALATAGHSLIFGAGSSGVMGAAARGFKDGGGKVHGVIPFFFEENGFEKIFYEADKITRTDTMAERKLIMEDGCDAFIIAPGGIGTLEEFFEALTLKQLGRHKKAVIVYNLDGYYDKLREFFDIMVEEKFVNTECEKLFSFFSKREEIIRYLETYSSDDITWNLLKK